MFCSSSTDASAAAIQQPAYERNRPEQTKWAPRQDAPGIQGRHAVSKQAGSIDAGVQIRPPKTKFRRVTGCCQDGQRAGRAELQARSADTKGFRKAIHGWRRPLHGRHRNFGRMTDKSSHASPPSPATVLPGLGGGFGPSGGVGTDLMHELANLLMIVLGGPQQLCRQPLDRQGQLQLACAEWGALHVARLMTPVLSQAQGEEGAIEIVDLNKVVGDLAKFIGCRADEHVHLATEAAPGHLPARLDGKLLDLVLLKLVRIAADAITDGGEVVVCARGPRLDGMGDQLTAELSAAGTGMGLAPDAAQGAADALSTKPHDRSTRLSLWMARRPAFACGGKIEAEAALGHGTTVRLVLPYAGNTELDLLMLVIAMNKNCMLLNLCLMKVIEKPIS